MATCPVLCCRHSRVDFFSSWDKSRRVERLSPATLEIRNCRRCAEIAPDRAALALADKSAVDFLVSMISSAAGQEGMDPIFI